MYASVDDEHCSEEQRNVSLRGEEKASVQMDDDVVAERSSTFVTEYCSAKKSRYPSFVSARVRDTAELAEKAVTASEAFVNTFSQPSESTPMGEDNDNEEDDKEPKALIIVTTVLMPPTLEPTRADDAKSVNSLCMKRNGTSRNGDAARVEARPRVGSCSTPASAFFPDMTVVTTTFQLEDPRPTSTRPRQSAMNGREDIETNVRSNNRHKLSLWRSAVQGLTFDVEHIPGIGNVIADVLSRCHLIPQEVHWTLLSMCHSCVDRGDDERQSRRPSSCSLTRRP